VRFHFFSILNSTLCAIIATQLRTLGLFLGVDRYDLLHPRYSKYGEDCFDERLEKFCVKNGLLESPLDVKCISPLAPMTGGNRCILRARALPIGGHDQSPEGSAASADQFSEKQRERTYHTLIPTNAPS